MVLPAKIFEIKGDVTLQQIAQALRGFHEEEEYETAEEAKVTLVTEVLDLKEEDQISGVFSKDFIRSRYYRRRLVETPVTEEAPFWIGLFQDRTFLICIAPSVARGVKKLLTNHVANKLSEIVFDRTGGVVELRISHNTLKELHESNPQATKLIWFDDVDIPNVDKLCLAGTGLADTGLYREYLEHGKIWYVVFEVQKHKIVVGITRSCVVTLFSRTEGETQGFIDFIKDNIFQLIET